MYTLLNTLYLTTEGTYGKLDHETVIISVDKKNVGYVPLLKLQQIVVGGASSISTGLIRKAGEIGIGIVWLTRNGTYANSTSGLWGGGVQLRLAHHAKAINEEQRLLFSKRIITQKLERSATTIRVWQKNRLNTDYQHLQKVYNIITEHQNKVSDALTIEHVMGLEGNAARSYFSAFDIMVSADWWHGVRTTRPPLDPMNALLSFGYTLLRSEIETALATVGLDSYMGLMHIVRAGRPALALDIMELYRSSRVDSLVIKMINNQQLKINDFEQGIGGDILMTEQARKKFIHLWEQDKQTLVKHTHSQEPIPKGLVSMVDARLLTRWIRQDLEL
jgi:CRISP-associated protein Cas1